MDTLSLDTSNFIEFRATPWDSRVFGFATNEILKVRYETEEGLDQLLTLFDEYNRAENITFTYVRVPGEDARQKAAVQRHGFYYAETSLLLAWDKRNSRASNFALRTGFRLEEPAGEDFERIREIARDSFHHGRFHEDCNIDPVKANQRYYLWIDDLRRQDKKFLVYKSGGKVQSFLVYTLENGQADLVLSGSDASAGFLSCYFWSAFMKYFADSGCRKAQALVSASNLRIINLYSRLDFDCVAMYAGFHKFYGLKGDKSHE